MSDFTYRLMQAMNANDLYPSHINTDISKFHRFTSQGTGCKRNCCQYRIFENYLGAHFKCFKRDIDVIWFGDAGRKPTMHEREEMKAERLKVQQQRYDYWNVQAKKSQHFFNLTKVEPGNHAYVLKKRIRPYYARRAKGLLVLPIRNIDYVIQSLQFIYPNGFKQFKTGATTKGGAIWLSEPLRDDYTGIIRLCEGYATGCSIYEAIGGPVLCALNCYNLPIVAEALKKKYSRACIKICADNDVWQKENKGLLAAVQAAKLTGAMIYWPEFKDEHRKFRPTDFNDLLCLEGIEAVEQQLINLKRKKR